MCLLYWDDSLQSQLYNRVAENIMSLLDQIRGKSRTISLSQLGQTGFDNIEVLSESELMGLVGSSGGGGGGADAAELERLRQENNELRRELQDTREELQSAGELIQRLQELSEA